MINLHAINNLFLAESTTFPPGKRREMSYFWTGYDEIVIFDTSAIKMILAQVWVCRPSEARVYTNTETDTSYFQGFLNKILLSYGC